MYSDMEDIDQSVYDSDSSTTSIRRRRFDQSDYDSDSSTTSIGRRRLDDDEVLSLSESRGNTSDEDQYRIELVEEDEKEEGESYEVEGDISADYFDIMTNLTTCDRDYLIRGNNKDDQVKVESLKGKTVLFFIARLPMNDYLDFLYNQLLIMYHELQRNHNQDFEVVLVVRKTGDQATFDKYFSNKVPFLAIPFEDSHSRARVSRLLLHNFLKYQYYITSCFRIVDPTGRYMPFRTVSIMASGIEAYPFTHERHEEICTENNAAFTSRSLEKLLGNRSRDYVLSIGSQSRIPILDLKSKLVALYFYCHGSEHLLTPLKNVYQQCRCLGLDFEVVVIHVNFEYESLLDYQEFLKDTLGDVPNWLALPFRDKTCFKLSQIFICPYDRLVVVGPEVSFVEEYAEDVICEYGIDAYPFTIDKVAHNERARLNLLTLDSLGNMEQDYYLINNDGVRFPLDNLKGRNVFVYFDGSSRPKGADYERLIEWYAEIKAIDAAFEVVYVCLAKKESSFQRYISTMPWLALAPYDLSHAQSVARKTLYREFSYLIAFGLNGRLLTNHAHIHLKRQGLDAYPFTHINLMDEVEQHLASSHAWPM